MTESTFIGLLRKNEERLFRFAMRFLKDVSLAEDAVQDLALKLWKKKESLNDYQNMDALMMTAMRNHCLDEIKKTKRRRNHYQNHKQLNSTEADSSHKALERKSMIEQVKLFVNELPETQREIVQLRDIEQLEMGEIERITGMNAGAIRTNLSRARKAIRNYLNEMNNYGLERNQTIA